MISFVTCQSAEEGAHGGTDGTNSLTFDFKKSYFLRIAFSGMLRRVACSVRQLLVTASVVHISPILFTLMKEALSSSETSVLARATQRNIT
jgi:hypothetical protein